MLAREHICREETSLFLIVMLIIVVRVIGLQ